MRKYIQKLIQTNNASNDSHNNNEIRGTCSNKQKYLQSQSESKLLRSVGPKTPVIRRVM